MSRVAVMTGSSSGIVYETSFFGKEPICNLWKKKGLTSMIYKLQEVRLLSIQNY
jgi:hypothetical protein